MSTRSNIAIRLREEDRNKEFTTPWGQTVSPEGRQFLYVYCHFDGYPDGVGVDLVNMFKDKKYEDALDYILMGDRSTTSLSYYVWRKEMCPPRPSDYEEDMFEEEYLYIIEEVNGKLHVNLWTPKEGYEDMTAEECSVDKESIKKAEQILIDNGIDEDEAGIVLQAIGYALLNEELYPEK